MNKNFMLIATRATPIRAASARAMGKQVAQETDEEDKENFATQSVTKKRKVTLRNPPVRKEVTTTSEDESSEEKKKLKNLLVGSVVLFQRIMSSTLIVTQSVTKKRKVTLRNPPVRKEVTTTSEDESSEEEEEETQKPPGGVRSALSEDYVFNSDEALELVDDESEGLDDAEMIGKNFRVTYLNLPFCSLSRASSTQKSFSDRL